MSAEPPPPVPPQSGTPGTNLLHKGGSPTLWSPRKGFPGSRGALHGWLWTTGLPHHSRRAGCRDAVHFVQPQKNKSVHACIQRTIGVPSWCCSNSQIKDSPWMQAHAGWPNVDPLWICVPHIPVTLNKQQRLVHPWTAFWLWSMPGESPFTVTFQIICTITHIYDHFILEIESGIKEQHHSTQINIIDERTIGAHSKLLHSNFSDLRCFLAYSSTSCYSLTPPCHRMLALLSWLEQDTTNSMPSWSMPQPPNLIRLTMIGDQIVQKWTSVPTKKVKWQIFQIDIQTRRWFLFPKICFQNLGERTPSKKGRKRNV